MVGQVLEDLPRGGGDQGRLLVLGQVEVQEFQGQPLQALSFGENVVGGAGLLLGRESSPAEEVGIAQAGGHGGLQLVGKAADEPVLPLHGGLQGGDVLLLPGGHGVKLPG